MQKRMPIINSSLEEPLPREPPTPKSSNRILPEYSETWNPLTLSFLFNYNYLVYAISQSCPFQHLLQMESQNLSSFVLSFSTLFNVCEAIITFLWLLLFRCSLVFHCARQSFIINSWWIFGFPILAIVNDVTLNSSIGFSVTISTFFVFVWE